MQQNSILIMCGCIFAHEKKHVKLLRVVVTVEGDFDDLVVELVLHFVLVFELVLVGFLEILGQDDVSVLP